MIEEEKDGHLDVEDDFDFGENMAPSLRRSPGEEEKESEREDEEVGIPPRQKPRIEFNA